MPGFHIDWRWVALIVFVALLASGRSLPWPITALAMGAGGGYLIYMAWQSWGIGGRSRGGARVTYWRGQRIETPGQPRRVRPGAWSELAPVILYTLIGVALLLGAAMVVLSRSGI
jgi:hypothetical protein